MKSVLVILVHLLFFGLVQSKRRYLVKVAGNKSLHEAHHGNKAKHYLVEVAGTTSLPRVHHGNKRRRGKADQKKEMKRERKGRGDKGRKKDYQDILEVKGSASNHVSGEDQTTTSLPTFTTLPTPTPTPTHTTTPTEGSASDHGSGDEHQTTTTLCNLVTNSLNRSQFLCLRLHLCHCHCPCHCHCHCHKSTAPLHCSDNAKIKR